MDKLPIDIHLTKLLDWILDRRHCPRDWQKSVLPIRNKINLAIQDMPEHEEITKLLTGTSIHYFNCLSIVSILKETEANTKNIFGMYSSQRMKDWNNIVSLYQKNNIYLAEAASILQRNVAYEIPALKKAINKCQQQQTECEDRHQSLNKSINEINSQIKQMCSDLGIQGVKISQELKELPKQLTSSYEEIVKKCSNLDKPYEFYANYVSYFFQRKSNDSALAMLGYVIKKGNTTVYEWRTGSQPKQIEKPEDVSYNFGDEENVNQDTIDFDVVDFNLNAEEILATQNTNGDQNEEIDWGDFDSNIEVAKDADVIDFDIEALKSEIVVEDAGIYIPTDGIAKGNDAFTLMEWTETRNLLLNDLVKLETFLKQKMNEMKSESDNILISTILQDAPKNVQSITEKDIKKYIDSVKDLQSYFKTKKLETLFRINDSATYLKRLYEQFCLKQKSIERCKKNQASLKSKSSDLVKEEVDLNDKLKLIISKTKELQKYVCNDLSKIYNGVRINLMGEINML